MAGTLAAFLKILLISSFKTSVMKILMGTLAGLVAGVTIGVLLAPMSGSETRHNIASGTKERWRRLWSKVDMDEDPWAEYNQRKAAAQQATS
jgi:gas vesicle protein